MKILKIPPADQEGFFFITVKKKSLESAIKVIVKRKSNSQGNYSQNDKIPDRTVFISNFFLGHFILAEKIRDKYYGGKNANGKINIYEKT